MGTRTMLGVFLDIDSVHPADIDLSQLKRRLPQWQLYPTTTAAQVAERIAGAQVVVSNKAPVSAAAIAAAAGLQLICIAATGTNNVDLAAARARGIPVCNVTGYASPAVVQHVFALVLALTTRLAEHRRSAHDGTWSGSPHFCVLDYPIRELAGKTFGVLGFGELGRSVAQVAEAFGMRVIVAQRPGAGACAGRVPLANFLASADVVSLHLPLADNTRGLIDAGALARMKPDALLINTARGGIVDEAALLEALQAGRLGGAGIDVLDREPPPPDWPLLQADLPRLIVTPHVAWASREARQRLVDQVAENIHAFTRGEPRNRVA